MEFLPAPNLHLSRRAQNDLQLVQSARHGDTKAYNLLFNRYYLPLAHFISKRTNNPDDIQDLTMEAFGKAFLKIGSYVPNYAFSTWLFQIACNHCIDFMRRQKMTHRQSAPLDYSALAGLPNPVLNPEEFLIKKEQAALVTTLVHRLPDHYAQVIILRFLEEKSYDEIATELNLPIGSVKAQLFRAKEMMRQLGCV